MGGKMRGRGWGRGRKGGEGKEGKVMEGRKRWRR
jgi:hypothetical protein